MKGKNHCPLSFYLLDKYIDLKMNIFLKILVDKVYYCDIIKKHDHERRKIWLGSEEAKRGRL